MGSVSVSVVELACVELAWASLSSFFTLWIVKVVVVVGVIVVVVVVLQPVVVPPGRSSRPPVPSYLASVHCQL